MYLQPTFQALFAKPFFFVIRRIFGIQARITRQQALGIVRDYCGKPYVSEKCLYITEEFKTYLVKYNEPMHRIGFVLRVNITTGDVDNVHVNIR